MKKHKIITSICALICILSLIIPTSAAITRASDQIRLYWADAVVTKGAINVEFSITGKNIMNKIGCESIYIYKTLDTRWIYVNSKTEDDSGMIKTQKSGHTNTIVFNGSAGVEYKVVVTVFAENDAGRDSRSQTFYVTGR